MSDQIPIRWQMLLLALLAAAFAAHAEDDKEKDKNKVQAALDDENERQAGAARHPAFKEFKTVPAKLSVPEVEVPAAFERSAEEFPADSHNVTAGPDGNWMRDGKPVFLFGVEAEMYNGAWLHRMLGIDFSELSILAAAEFRRALKVDDKPGPGGVHQLETSLPASTPWLDLRIKEALRGGTLITYEHLLNRSGFFPLSYEKYSFDPPVYCPGVPGSHKCSSHFFDLCQENPAARQLYLNMLRWNGRQARAYPVWMYELINEVSYICPCAENTRRFRAAMEKKYGSIEKANAVWRTSIASFDRVIPPLNTESAVIYNSVYGSIPHGAALSVPLWIDWMRWMEGRGMEVFRDLRDEMKKVDPRAVVTIQSPYVAGSHAQTPASKAAVEDVYGAENVLMLFRQTAGAENWPEVRQMFGQQLASDLCAAASPQKPVVNLECTINGYPRPKQDAKNPYIIGAAGMRTFFWHQAVHGIGGSVISYFYGNATSDAGGSVWDPMRMSLDAVREMPRIRNEILSVAEIVLPKPRIKGRMAVLFSHETSRIIRPEAGDKWRKYGSEVLDYYAAATLSRVPLDTITTREVLADKLADYALVILPHAYRVPPGTVEKLAEYVKSGGNLLLSPDSLRFDDDFGQRLDTAELLGGRAGAPILDARTLAFEADAREVPGGPTAGLESIPSGEEAFDFARPVHGYEFEPAAAKVLARAGNAPAFCVNALGKGRVYYLALEPNAATRRACINWTVRACGAKPDVDVRFDDKIGAAADYVETHLFQKGAQAVIYALNFGGGPRQARLVPLEAGRLNVTIRDVRTGSYLSPAGAASAEASPWTPQQYAAGIPVALPSQDPVVLLVEDAAAKPLALREFTAEQKEVLKWLYRPSPPSNRPVLIDAAYGLEGRMHCYRMPTAVKLLEDDGCHVESLCSPLTKPLMRNGEALTQGKLSDYRVFIITGPESSNKLGKDDAKIVLDYVRAGGGLLYCPSTDWHSGKDHRILQELGLETPFANFYENDPAKTFLKEPMYVVFAKSAEHPVTEGVKTFHAPGAVPLTVTPRAAGAAVLFKGSESSYTYHPWGQAKAGPGAPFAVALEFGKGRIVVVGGDSWLRPDDLERGDNKRLFMNAIQWLEKRK